MNVEDVTGKLFEQVNKPYMYVPSNVGTDTSVDVFQIDSMGYVVGNRTMTVRTFEDESIELVGEYAGLPEARSAVARLTGNPEPNP